MMILSLIHIYEEVLEADIQAAAEALYEALDNLVFRADRTLSLIHI